MLPHEREMVQRTYRNKPFVFLGVAMDSADTLKDFAKNNPLPWPNIVDGSRTISREWNIEYVPSALLVDHNGVIRKVWMAGFSPDEVWAEVAKAVTDAQSE
jgi:peroxiredoxin